MKTSEFFTVASEKKFGIKAGFFSRNIQDF